MSKSGVNLQDGFLNQIRKDRKTVSMSLLSGATIRGTVIGFDNFTVLLRQGERKHLIYKHAIAHIETEWTPEDAPRPALRPSDRGEARPAERGDSRQAGGHKEGKGGFNPIDLSDVSLREK